MFLIIEEIKEEIKIFLESNENELPEPSRYSFKGNFYIMLTLKKSNKQPKVAPWGPKNNPKPKHHHVLNMVPE